VITEDINKLNALDLLPGDILLHLSLRKKNKKSIISAFTQSPYTHASIYVGRNKIAEAVPPKLRTQCLESVLTPESCIGVLRSQANFTKRRADTLNNFVECLIKNNTRYDFSGVIKFPKNRKKYQEDIMNSVSTVFIEQQHETTEALQKRSYFCSAFVVACYMIVGIIEKSAHASYRHDVLCPADLYRDPTFGWLFGYLVHDINAVPEDDPLRGITSWNAAL
jgi:hypothetical protein